MSSLPSLSMMITRLRPFYPSSALSLKDWSTLQYMAAHVKTSGEIWDKYVFYQARGKTVRFLYPESSPENGAVYVRESIRRLRKAGLVEVIEKAGPGRTQKLRLLVADRFRERKDVIDMIEATAKDNYAFGNEVAAQCRVEFTPRNGNEPVPVPACLTPGAPGTAVPKIAPSAAAAPTSGPRGFAGRTGCAADWDDVGTVGAAFTQGYA